MSNIDVFTIEDDFDPLAEIDLEMPDAEERYLAEYVAPIPDADKTVMPERPALTPDEKIEKLLEGIPGQQFRILSVIEAATPGPVQDVDIVEAVDERYPGNINIYDTPQLLRLLVDAEAIDRAGGQSAPVVEEDGDILLTENNFVTGEDGETYLVVAQDAPATYTATEAGRAAVARYLDAGALEAIIAAEPRYAPLYARIMSMVSADGGATTPQLDGAIDPDPLCQEPRRFCGYFIDKLETAGLVEWSDAWRITSLGREALATGVLDAF